MKGYTLAPHPRHRGEEPLPKKALSHLLVTRQFKESGKLTREAFRAAVVAESLTEEEENARAEVTVPAKNVAVTTPLWATDNYEHKIYDLEEGEETDSVRKVAGHRSFHHIPHKPQDLALIVPRVEKTKEEQKKRTKEKAEVFTPSWLCAQMADMADNEVVYPGAFNLVPEENSGLVKSWTPNGEKIDFSRAKQEGPVPTWEAYVRDPRLELCCGEAPYLVSRYDTVTGKPIPVRDEEGRYARIGLLDRKLRVVGENVGFKQEDKAVWREWACQAVASTFGTEWSGDNLLLARLNVVNTVIDFYVDHFGKATKEEREDLAETVAALVSWTLIQIDGLKQVVPNSCSDGCVACKKKLKVGHDGVLPLLKMDGEVLTFEQMFPREELAAAFREIERIRVREARLAAKRAADGSSEIETGVADGEEPTVTLQGLF